VRLYASGLVGGPSIQACPSAARLSGELGPKRRRRTARCAHGSTLSTRLVQQRPDNGHRGSVMARRCSALPQCGRGVARAVSTASPGPPGRGDRGDRRFSSRSASRRWAHAGQDVPGTEAVGVPGTSRAVPGTDGDITSRSTSSNNSPSAACLGNCRRRLSTSRTMLTLSTSLAPDLADAFIGHGRVDHRV
jgi:hypothetical protein